MKLVNIFICPEFDLIQKSRCFTMGQKRIKKRAEEHCELQAVMGAAPGT